MQQRHVVVAVTFVADRGFFVSFDDKWRGYSFPMRKSRNTDVSASHTAVRALEEAVGQRLPQAIAKPLSLVEIPGLSMRTGQNTLYQYETFEVDAGLPLPDGEFTSRGGFLSYDDLLAAELVTWSTKEIISALMGNQQVALAVVSRTIGDEREYLMVWNPNYQGYFFPTARFKSDSGPAIAAIDAVRSDTGYRGRIRAAWIREVPDVHFSNRFNQERRYLFHLCKVELPGVDLRTPDNKLETSLGNMGQKWDWISESQLKNVHANNLSETVEVVRLSVLSADPQ